MIVCEEFLVNKKNQRLSYLIKLSPLFDKLNKVIGVLGILVDISERKAVEEELVKIKEQAVAANELKSELIRNMEHDIRTPLVGVSGLTEYLTSVEKDPEKKALQKKILACARELSDYCNSIVNFAKIERVTFPVQIKRINMYDLMSSIYKMEKPTALLKQLDFEINMHPTVPQFLMGDRYRVQSILLNLISNAIKYTHKGSVSLIIKPIRTRNDSDIKLKFIVADTGIGIPAKIQQNMVSKFSSKTLTTKQQPDNQCLGLRIVKQFIAEMAGDIKIKSNPNKGTEVSCIIAFKLL